MLVFTGIMIFLADGCQGDRRTQSTLQREKTEDLQKKKMVLVASLFFYKALFTSVYGTMTASISCLNFSHLSVKWSPSQKDRLRYPPSADISSEQWQSAVRGPVSFAE